MRLSLSITLKFLVLQCLYLVSFSQDFDYFYFVQQWPGAYCDSRQSCCYPKTGKPAADFGIHGLWPNYKDGSWPSNCNSSSLFDKSQISDLISPMQHNWPTLSCPSNDGIHFWTHEWEKHGTCAESKLDQHAYFEAALKLKEKANLLHILDNSDIRANDEFYNLDDIMSAIKEGTGFSPGIECNMDRSHNKQLYQIYMCADTSGSEFIECPVLRKRKCHSTIQFPKF